MALTKDFSWTFLKFVYDNIIHLVDVNRSEITWRKKMNSLIDFLFDDQGATAVEYAILASAIAAVIAAVVVVVGSKTADNFNTTNNAL